MFDYDLEAYCLVDAQMTDVLYKRRNKMNGHKLKRGQYLIGTIDKHTGMVSFAMQPKIHYDFDNALTEAKRLAGQTPKKKFVVVQVKAIASAVDIVVE